MGGYCNLNIHACLFKLARDGGFAEIIVYAQCMLFEVKVRVELPESRSFKRQKLLWFCAVQVHTCQEGYCTSGSKTTLYCGMQWTDCSSKVLPYLYLLEVIFLVYVLCFQCMLFLWGCFTLHWVPGSVRAECCQAFASEFLNSLCVLSFVLIMQWLALCSLYSGIWGTTVDNLMLLRKQT